jgi:hypothetical protein
MNHLFASYQKNIATGDGNRFAARPLNHWRKSYQNSLGYSRASTGMPMDRPGGLVPVASPQIQCMVCRGALPSKVTIFNDSKCKSCQPIATKVKPIYFPINKLIKYDTAYTDNTAYLQSRCTTYDQKLSTESVPSIVYFSANGVPLEPSDNPNGVQVRETENCLSPLIQECKTTIYKPNNTQFAQQGGVSSSARLSRLKYNTLNQNGAEYNSANGAMGVNSGRYQMEPSPSYYTKYKPQPIVCKKTRCGETTK